MSDAVRLGILGGTLDPMHLGHVETALAARAALGLDRVVVLPARVPPHRPMHPHASAFHRFAMAALAVDGLDGLAVSDLELRAPGPSYTADTLARLHDQGLASSQIFFITGADAFAEIETWSRYPAVLDLAHFVVVSRPGHPAGGMKARVPVLAGRMYSAALVEEHLAQPAIFLLDARTPDVSSTEIRRRVAGGESLAGLVPKAIERHIVKHGLYSTRTGAAGADHLHGEDD